MKKRLISIILAVSMLGSLIAVQAAEETETTAAPVFADVSGLPCEEAVNHLAGLGVINGRGDGTYAPGDSLSRAEMVAIILRGFGSEDIEDIEKFRDVPPSHWAYMYIETAYKMGIVNGVTETTFAPEGTVTYEQAVKMLVCAVNKGDKAEAEGGWPDGYIKIAEEMDVLQGIDAAKGEAISRGTMAQLVYNFIAIAEDEFSYMYDWNNGTVEEHYNWIRDEKIRGAYAGIADMNVDDTGFMKRLNKAGCNTYFLNLLAAGYPYKTPEGCIQLLDECQEWLKGYENCHTFVKINFGDNGFAKWEDYRKFHPGVYKSSYTTSTCPLDKDYWDKQLLERCIMIAERPVYEGIILDHEMYYGSSGYSSSCMCDYCWSEYIKAKGLGGEWASVAITERSEYVTSKNAREDYNDWFYDETVKMFADLREKVHAVNPKIIFGYMPGYEWMKGITEGLGTPER
ncbi:MAG: S-layer homology domain-containing protein, partial [Clostridia bacterium]|nr:S-layer homology domain-containing protein [Clostridia bacterium]